jgi:prophage regulatory protein
MISTGVKMNTDASSSDRIIKIREVIAMTGLSRSSIYLQIKKGTFPVQVKLSTRSSGWLWSEINGWLVSRPRAS